MLKYIEILKKRPSDSIIRIIQVVFSIVFMGTLYYNLIYLGKNLDYKYASDFISNFSATFTPTSAEIYKEYIVYSIMVLWLPPLLVWVFNLCIMKKLYMRITLFVYAMIIFYIWAFFPQSTSIDYDFIITLLGLAPLMWAITGKSIQKKCFRTWEKVTKIRV